MLALVLVVIASREIYKANAYQFNVYKRRLMGMLSTGYRPEKCTSIFF